MNRTLPVVVIGGYLGAGKTTLVNHLLRHADGRGIAVLVNDFGAIAIDADLIEAGAADSQAQVLSLSGGCLCCSFGDDLVGTLRTLQQRVPAPELLLIELSGVALPASVRRTLTLVSGIECAGTLVLADAAALRAQLADRHVGDTVLQQLREADWVLLNKPELAAPAELPALQRWLAEAAPASRVLVGAADTLPPELVLGWRADPGREAAAWTSRPLAVAPKAAPAVFASRSARLADGLDLAALAAVLAAPVNGVLRAKALARDASGQGQLLQLAGGRWALTQAPHAALVPDAGRLVLIGLAGTVDATGYSLPGVALDPLA